MSAAAVVEQSVAAFALHALWQVPLLACAARCAVRIGRPHARIAHAVWVGTLLLCVALPASSTVAARHAAFEAERAASAAFVSYDSAVYEGELQLIERQPMWKRMLHRHVNSHDGLQPFAVALPQRWVRLIAGGWLLVVAFFSVQLLMGWMRVRALVRGASDDPLPKTIASALQRQCNRLHLPVPLAKLHDSTAGPVLAGVVRPTLLLPADSALEMAPAEIEAVLAHELAHLRRRDPLVHAACSLLLLPVCFHPAALWAARSVRQTREMACDAEAAQSMGSHVEYAWALLQVAERTSNGRSHASAAGFFSNGLFGAGLQLFTNRGAMEERMQMLMNGNGSKVGGRAVRAAAGVSLATLAVVAATMLQVQPTLAAERSLPQTAAATQQLHAVPQTSSENDAQDAGPRLLGGDHAREQLRRAKRELSDAERQAATDHDRQVIATTRGIVKAAEDALASANGSRAQQDSLEKLSDLKLHLDALKQIDMDAVRQQMDKQREAMANLQARFSSPAWKAEMQKQSAAMARLQAQLHSPEFRAQMEEVRKLDQPRIEALMAQARAQQEKAMEQFRSGAQRQIGEARLIARNELPAPVPAPSASFPADAAQQGSDRTVKIAPGVIAGNKIGGSNPVYPPAAKEKRIQGAVVLHAIIDKTGHVETIQVASSPDDQLSKAAVDAVQTWIYKPYLLNGDPTAVDTTITVNFSLMP